jgi:putative spermidine/putrescine transport system ATP-binding protein
MPTAPSDSVPGTAPHSRSAGQGAISLLAVTKRYGDERVVDDVSLEIQPGEFFSLLGPSGSGKTTTLMMIAGFAAIDEGRILVDAVDIASEPPQKRGFGMVFQNYAIFPHLNVFENVAFPLRARRRPANEVNRRVIEALALVRLERFGERFARQLSGGQQQRVAIARAIVFQPKVVLMDEPLGALDKKLREHMQIEIKQLHRETGATIIYVTHDQEEALALSDRICLMNHARIEQLGTPHDIYARPATAFAADFIGISNIFRGQVDTASNGEILLSTRHGKFRLPAGAVNSGAEAAIVVRPEQISLGATNGNTVMGRVVDAVYAGSETRLIVDLEEGENVIVRLPPGQSAPAYGERAALGWNPDAAVLVP